MKKIRKFFFDIASKDYETYCPTCEQIILQENHSNRMCHNSHPSGQSGCTGEFQYSTPFQVLWRWGVIMVLTKISLATLLITPLMKEISFLAADVLLTNPAHTEESASFWTVSYVVLFIILLLMLAFYVTHRGKYHSRSITNIRLVRKTKEPNPTT